MSEPAIAARPYRDGIAAGLGCGLAAGLVIGLVDVVLTLGAPGGAGFAPALIALWLVPGLVIGLGAGVVAAAVKATWGDGAIGAALARLRRDRQLDIEAAGVVLAAAVAAVVLIGVVAVGAGVLVAGVQRKGVGALLLGVAVVAALPAVAALALPAYRVTRRLAVAVPRLGPVPRLLVLVVGAVAAVLVLGLFFVLTRLDWRALQLGAFGLAAALPIAMLLIAVVAYGPLDGTRRRLPGTAVLAAAVVAALALILVALRGQPAPATVVAVTEHATGGGLLVRVGRGLADGDGDGHSAFFGGPDCDDSRASVHVGAPEIPGNGIDDNCTGGDRVASAEPTAAPAEPTAAPARPRIAFDGNVLVLVIDTVRADRLGVAGYQRDGKSLTPRLDALAAESVRFTRAYAQAPNTPRSMPSFMASRYPSQIAVDESFKNYPRVDDGNEMLFETLKGAGLATIGVASHFYFRDERNFTQGFDRFDNEGALDIAPSNKDIASPRIVPRALDELGTLAASKQRFAMFVHLFEPHSTYVEHDGFTVTERGTAALEQKYDYEIAFTDRWIGTLLDGLKEKGLADTTAIVIMSDHGEAFGVHSFAGQRMFFHGQTLYDELLRVPLIIKVPGVAPRTVDSVVQLIDVAPTVAELIGAPRPASWVGRSLVPALAGDALAERPAYGELLPAPSWKHDAKALVSGDGRWKLFYRISDGRYELYDLAADPDERKDLWGKAGEAATAGKQLQEQMLEWIEVGLAK